MQIIAINGISLVGLPLSTCQNYIKVRECDRCFSTPCCKDPHLPQSMMTTNGYPSPPWAGGQWWRGTVGFGRGSRGTRRWLRHEAGDFRFLSALFLPRLHSPIPPFSPRLSFLRGDGSRFPAFLRVGSVESPRLCRVVIDGGGGWRNGCWKSEEERVFRFEAAPVSPSAFPRLPPPPPIFPVAPPLTPSAPCSQAGEEGP